MEDLKKTSKVSIRLPGGYAPEDGTMPGDRVRAVVELELGENGQATVISVDGSKYETEEPRAPAAKPVVMEEVQEEMVEEPESADPFAAKLMA